MSFRNFVISINRQTKEVLVEHVDDLDAIDDGWIFKKVYGFDSIVMCTCCRIFFVRPSVEQAHFPRFSGVSVEKIKPRMIMNFSTWVEEIVSSYFQPLI